MKALKRDGLYYVSMAKNDEVVNISSAAEDQNIVKGFNCWKGGDINVWHRRLGHVSEDVVKKTVPVDGKLKMCEECMSSKFDRAPFNDVIEREKNVLERVYSDVCGPMEEVSFGGSKYFVSFIDGFSRYASIYTISNKYEVFNCFEDYCRRVELSTSKRIQAFRSDNGGEYVNFKMKNFCKMKGINMELTSPYSSQQNGMAERYNRSLLIMTRSMLSDAKMDKRFWAEAMRTAVYLKNVSASRVLNWRSPFEIWTNKKPKIDYLRTFGSVAYVRIPDASRLKLDQRGKKVIFLGYDLSSMIYRVLDVENNTVLRRRDVRVLDTEHTEEIVQNDEWLEEERNNQNLHANRFQLKDQTTEIETDVGGTSTIQEDKPSKGIPVEEENNWSNEVYQTWKNPQYTTRSGRISKLPGRFQDYVSLGITNTEVQVPNTYKEATESKGKYQWEQSILEELNNLKKNRTWEIVDRPRNKNIVGCKWIFRLKKGPNGEITKFKSRLVAKGYSQRFGEDYNETYSPVGNYTTIRCLLALSACMDLKLYHFDFECAYLNGTLNEEEEIYMEIPQGYEVEDNNKVLKLRKCLYGLKQSGRSWNNELDRSLKDLNLIQSKTDRCLYTRINGEKRTLVLVYVDDLAIASNDEDFVNNIKTGLKQKFVLKDLQGLNHFLGINIERTMDGIFVDQKLFILKMLNQYGMENCKPILTPMQAISDNRIEDVNNSVVVEENIPYRCAIGSLNYLATISRPDIAFAVNRLAKKVECPTVDDWIAVKRIFRYLQGTKDEKILYKKYPQLKIDIYSDADYGGDSDRKSTSGYVALINEGAVAWTSRKQSCVALSTMESEYIALANAAQEGLYLIQILQDMGIKKSLAISVDNQSCILFAGNERGPGKAKHIEIKYHFVKDLVENGKLKLNYVESMKNAADLFTKSLNKEKHSRMLSMIGFCCNNN